LHYFAGGEHIAQIGELQPLACILLDEDERLAAFVAERTQRVEDHVDGARLETDRRLVDQERVRIHDQGAGDLEQAPLAA
jgi:hypothetical protein